tara:strand:- start:685 stop:969 length:285 start_codon:yes stop_codon:yes gene_type:complete
MSMIVLDPTHESVPVGAQLAARLGGLEGTTVGFISNGKEGTKGFFRHLEGMLRDDFGVAEVIHRVKSSYSAPADAHIMEEAKASWHAVVSGIGD